MDLQPINKEDCEKIKNNLKDISLLYYYQNCDRTYKLYEEQQEIAKLLNKYNLYLLINQCDTQTSATTRIIDYIDECEKVYELIKIIDKYNWSLENTQKYFKVAEKYIQNMVDKKIQALEWQIKNLSQKTFNELLK